MSIYKITHVPSNTCVLKDTFELTNTQLGKDIVLLKNAFHGLL